MSGAAGNRPNGLKALKHANQRQLLELISTERARTQEELEEHTDLARSSISALLKSMVNVLRTDVVQRPSGGRPLGVYSVKAHLGAVIGVDVGASHVTVAVADLLGEPMGIPAQSKLGKGRRSLSNPSAASATAVELVLNVMDREGLRPDQVAAIGLGLPGAVVGQQRTMIDPGAHRWNEEDVPDRVREALGFDTEVVVDNDANLSALAEQRKGAGVGASSIAFFKWSAGCGSGLVLGGRLWRGASGGKAGELGHAVIPISDKERVKLRAHGDRCDRCHHHDCIEVLIGGGHLPKRLGFPSLIAMIEAASAGGRAKAKAQPALEAAGAVAGRALGLLSTIIDPERIVVGGQIVAADGFELVESAMRAGLAETSFLDAPDLVAGELTDRAAVEGAIVNALIESRVDFLMRSVV
jgi:predicted NBD/HSP70 family sugar kinase